MTPPSFSDRLLLVILKRRGILFVFLMCVSVIVVGLLFWSSSTPQHLWASTAQLQLALPQNMQLADPQNKVKMAETSSASSSLPAQSSEHARCHDVMGSMTQGRWLRKAMTTADVQKMNTFHKHVREVEHKIPRGLQRQDGRCGNLSFADGDGEHPKWFRALCDAERDTPCCYHNRCVSRTSQDCACPDCYDTRNPLHAEHASWRPWKKECEVKEMSVDEICRLLENATLYFIGDSLVRHVYTALLLAVRGDSQTGGFRRDIPKDMKSRCSGLYMFTEKECRHWVDGNVKVCPGKTTHLQLWYMAENAGIVRPVSQLSHKPRSLAFIGLGFHGGLKAHDTFKKVMQPVVQQRTKSHLQWPQLVWASIHHRGTLKNPNLPNQSIHHVHRFNEMMKQHLRTSDVAVFDTFNMTARVESFDGSHYGYGVNRVKVQILLNFLKELQLRGRW